LKGQTIHYILHTRSTSKDASVLSTGNRRGNRLRLLRAPRPVDIATRGCFFRMVGENSGAPHFRSRNQVVAVVPCCPSTSTHAKVQRRPPLCHPDPDFLYVAPSKTACAVFSKENRTRGLPTPTSSTGNPGERSGEPALSEVERGSAVCVGGGANLGVIRRTSAFQENRNSLVRRSLMVSRSLAAFSNSNFLAASRMSDSSLPM
jgi:hypothetical protein